MRVSAAEWAVALVVGLLLYGALAASLVLHPPLPDAEPVAAARFPGSGQLGAAFLGTTQVTPSEDVSAVPKAGYEYDPPRPGESVPKFRPPQTHRHRQPVAYLLPFEVVSVHLLVVLIAAAYLARAKRRRQAASGVSA
jgi:NADH-quinone oxidoreductase subunit J